ncbi:uncharacterized protein EDB93DRAFT_1093034 [Suillus bovinus]|uniref:uncharacterized protein n=1 Tax=Suillus bovinus TaxID=48563 RepID=UPI001B86E5FA|nr:uncharacterized protein EDB93DRAFT_1093034 [Suillus bovinus]KAG2133809.1 hypothetical protein EDB93DRAFT_1093034 [Suillus bovinus]
MAKAELWLSPVVQTLFARSPPPLRSRRRTYGARLKLFNQQSANLNVGAVMYSIRHGAQKPLFMLLHLLNDDFDDRHELVQTQVGNSYSDYLHSIAHRREPEYWNSKYWIARFSHEYLPEIYSPGSTITQAKQEMEKFVGAVQTVETSGKGVPDHEKGQ